MTSNDKLVTNCILPAARPCVCANFMFSSPDCRPLTFTALNVKLNKILCCIVKYTMSMSISNTKLKLHYPSMLSLHHLTSSTSIFVWQGGGWRVMGAGGSCQKFFGCQNMVKVILTTCSSL